jgi:hypothetical protein
MESKSPEVIRRFAKYVFLDVVQFSMRTSETQSYIVDHFNSIVRESLNSHKVIEEDSILIPTGDGICIALLNINLPFDIHMQISLSILKSLHTYNTAANEAEKCLIRIGINQNSDVIVTDINGRRNIAGAGINDASRIMGKADGNQILMSRAVFDELQPSEKYAGSFRHFTAVVKHNIPMQVYQYVSENQVGLNINTPSAWRRPLTPIVAYYFAHAIKNRDYLVKNQSAEKTPIAIILLWLLATDSCGHLYATEINPHVNVTHRELASRIWGLKESFAQRLNYYSRPNQHDAGILAALLRFIIEVLSRYQGYFQSGRFPPNFIFVNERGEIKLKEEWPDIWAELK